MSAMPGNHLDFSCLFCQDHIGNKSDLSQNASSSTGSYQNISQDWIFADYVDNKYGMRDSAGDYKEISQP